MNELANQQSLNELALFAGAGGGILGGHLLGWRTICAVEWEPYPASVLCARQNDGFLPPFPIWDDIQTFDGKPWQGIVDVISGGFPCQDISAAGKGAGIDGERSGMWKEMARVICEVRPRFVFVENSPMLTSRGLGRVLGDLAAMGFNAKWGVLGAADVGAPHQRDRIWIVARQRNFLSHTEHNRNGWREQQSKVIEETNGKIAYATSIRPSQQTNQFIMESQRRDQLQFGESRDSSNVAHTNIVNDAMRGNSQDNAEAMVGRELHARGSISDSGSGCKEGAGQSSDVANAGQIGFTSQQIKPRMEGRFRFAISSLEREWWDREPAEIPRTVERGLGRVVNGVAARVDRLKAIGNGQVPLCAATAWKILSEQ